MSNYNYGNYPYGNVYHPYNNPIQQPQQVQQQTIPFLPLTFTNGLVGAKSYIVTPNQTVYLKDSDSNLLFEKSADAYGKYTLKAYELKEISVDDIGKDKQSEPKVNYVTLEEFTDLKTKVEELLKAGANNEQ